MYRKEQISEIKEIYEQQKAYFRKMVLITLLPKAKRKSTGAKRLNKIIEYGILVKQLEARRMMLVESNRVIPFMTGGIVSGTAMLGEKEKEILISDEKPSLIMRQNITSCPECLKYDNVKPVIGSNSLFCIRRDNTFMKTVKK